MSTELPRTYVPFKDWKEKSKQIEYTEPTPLLNIVGTLNAEAGQDTTFLNMTESSLKENVLSAVRSGITTP